MEASIALYARIREIGLQMLATRARLGFGFGWRLAPTQDGDDFGRNRRMWRLNWVWESLRSCRKQIEAELSFGL
ncbi:hypothetical protein IEQ34_003991 [Dendrobium chrysotoxum]|uniref:Uncharacterized protein n=1 Tax=Dendrobium chrysotoxum TaxID=161865 RepID=A0AAV7HFE3_DENCH|nr:hypothetical protein IEQ34_003991 [Dendrobium chrysotoxum]